MTKVWMSLVCLHLLIESSRSQANLELPIDKHLFRLIVRLLSMFSSSNFLSKPTTD